MIFKSKTTVLFSILLFAVGYFLLISFSLQLFTNAYSPDFIPGDTYTYINAARLLFEEFRVNAVRPYGYSILCGVPFLYRDLPSQNDFLTWSYILNLLIWLSTIIVLFKTLNKLTSLKMAFIATIAFIGCVGNIAQLASMMTEPAACLFITLLGYFLVNFYIKKSLDHLALALAMAILVVLIRPGMLYFAIVLIAIFMAYAVIHKERLSKRNILVILIPVMLVSVQILGNKMLYGNLSMSYIDKYTWYTYLGAESMADYKNKSFLEIRDQRRLIINPMAPRDYHRLATNDFKAQINSHPSLILKHFISNIRDNIIVGNIRISGADDYKQNPYFNHIRYYLYLISKFQNILFSTIGLGLLMWCLYNRKSLVLFIGSTLIFYIIFTSGVSFWEGDRFNTVFYPLVIILVTLAIVESRKGKVRE